MPALPRIAGLIAVAVATAVAGAHEASAQEASPAVRYRSQIMSGLQDHVGALRTLAGGDVDHPEHVLDHARAIRALSLMAADVFPEGSGGEPTRAKDEIWQDWDGFMAKLTELQDAAAALVVAAESGDTSALAPAVQTVNGTCRGCHQPYRKPANR